jgi:hypothetical protein
MSERQLHLFKGKRQKGEPLPEPSEAQLQRTLVQHLEVGGDPRWIWTAFPAGELRDKATAGKLKGMGLKPGFFDMLFIDPDGVHHWLELKVGRNRLSEAQAAFSLCMQARRVPCEVARSIEEALAILSGWGAIRVRIGA